MSNISNRLQTLAIPGPSGNLEALLFEGHPEARYAALVCHPHPKGGGTMHNKVVYRAAKTMQSFGLPTLRFNFRGTGLSEGEHDEGRGEREDVRAAIDWLTGRYNLPVLLVGFSFGAYVSLRACCGDARVPGLVALGLPVEAEGRGYSYDFLSSCTLPKLFLSGGHDQYGPQARAGADRSLRSRARITRHRAGGRSFLRRQARADAGRAAALAHRALLSWRSY